VTHLAFQTERFENVPSVLALFLQTCKTHCVDYSCSFSRWFGSYFWPLTTKDFNMLHAALDVGN
jgi:hypothetical protein